MRHHAVHGRVAANLLLLLLDVLRGRDQVDRRAQELLVHQVGAVLLEAWLVGLAERVIVNLFLLLLLLDYLGLELFDDVAAASLYYVLLPLLGAGLVLVLALNVQLGQVT